MLQVNQELHKRAPNQDKGVTIDWQVDHDLITHVIDRYSPFFPCLRDLFILDLPILEFFRGQILQLTGPDNFTCIMTKFFSHVLLYSYLLFT